MAQITDTGYVAMTQNEYFAEYRQLYLNIDPNFNLDPSTLDGLKIAKDAEYMGNFDEVLQYAYNSKDPSKATGIDLNIVCALTGTTRNDGTPSTVKLLLTGVTGILVRQGSIVDSGVDTPQWSTDSDVTFGANGTVEVTATCLVNGATEADVNGINRIVTTVGGWQKVQNTEVPTLGTDPQTDESLRIERELSVGRPGNNQIDSMLGEIFAVGGVRRARDYNNRTKSDAFDPVHNPHSLPANSISVIVDGGSDEDVAKAIFTKLNPGPLLNAAGTPVVVPNVYNLYPSNAETITFSRPIYVDQIITANIQNDGTLPTNIADLIKAAIIEYAEGILIPSSVGFNTRGYDIGQSVPVQQMATPINKVIGVYGYSYIIDLTIQGAAAGVSPIAFNEIARFSSANITINVVT